MVSGDRYFELGKIIRVKGVKGEVELFIDSDNPAHYKNLNSVLVKLNGELVPFFIHQISIHKRFATVKFEGVDSLEDALYLADKEVFLPLEKLPPLPGNRYYLHDLDNCRVVDHALGYLGNISGITDVAGQPVAAVNKVNHEILFPLHHVFIEKLDKESNTLFVNLPEGLVAIYNSGNLNQDLPSE